MISQLARVRWPGVARRLVTFFVSPKKVTKERRPRCATPSGQALTEPSHRGGSATRPGRAYKKCPAVELGQCSPSSPLTRSSRGGAEGETPLSRSRERGGGEGKPSRRM